MAFSKAAESYLKAAKVQTEIGKRLVSRLDYFKLSPARVLDLGSGPGTFTRELKRHFPQASVIACDLSVTMLQKIKPTLRFKPLKISADAVCLPFKENSFDFIFFI